MTMKTRDDNVQMISELLTATSTTVAGARIVITTASRIGQRVYLVSASYTTDAGSSVLYQDGTQYTISCTANGSTTLTSAALFGNVVVDMGLSGDGVVAGSRVTAKASDSSITVSTAVTAGSEPAERVFAGTSVYGEKAEQRTTTFAQQSFTPRSPIPISNEGQAAIVAMNCSAAGRLSIVYGFGL